MQAQVNFMFHYSRTAGSSIKSHHHRCCELVYYATGTGTTRLNETMYRYEPHTYTLIPPFVPHDEYRAEHSEVFCIGFTATSSLVAQLRTGLYRDGESAPIFAALGDIMDEMKAKRPYYHQKLQLRVIEMLIEHMRSVAVPETSRTEDSLLYSRSYIDEHFEQKLSVQELADLAGYSYHRFRHLFKEAFGMSPIQYVIDRRLERARSLLAHTDLPLAEIAAVCGFSNVGQFCSLFKRELKETPLSYRHNSYRNTLFLPSPQKDKR